LYEGCLSNRPPDLNLIRCLAAVSFFIAGHFVDASITPADSTEIQILFDIFCSFWAMKESVLHLRTALLPPTLYHFAIYMAWLFVPIFSNMVKIIQIWIK
jgi:hypothetical protein